MPFLPGDADSQPYTFDEATIIAFAATAGDLNPLHHDRDAAAKTRFKGLIASGAHMTAVLMGAGATYLSRAHEAAGLEFTYRFERAIPAGTQAMLSWTILAAEPHAKLGGTHLTIEGAITGLDGTRFVAVMGKAIVWDKWTQSV